MPDAPTDPSAAPTRARPARSRTTDLALVAYFAALIAVCAILPALPISGLSVPITLQTFGVLLAGACLGPVRGFLAASLYVVVGLAGLPIFTQGRGGLGVLAEPSVGYLLSFPLTAAACGLLVVLIGRRSVATAVPLTFVAAALAALLVNHPLGIAGLHLSSLGMAWGDALAADLVFVPGDLVKCAAVAVVASAVHRAFPDLLRRR